MLAFDSSMHNYLDFPYTNKVVVFLDTPVGIIQIFKLMLARRDGSFAFFSRYTASGRISDFVSGSPDIGFYF